MKTLNEAILDYKAARQALRDEEARKERERQDRIEAATAKARTAARRLIEDEEGFTLDGWMVEVKHIDSSINRLDFEVWLSRNFTPDRYTEQRDMIKINNRPLFVQDFDQGEPCEEIRFSGDLKGEIWEALHYIQTSGEYRRRRFCNLVEAILFAQFGTTDDRLIEVGDDGATLVSEAETTNG